MGEIETGEARYSVEILYHENIIKVRGFTDIFTAFSFFNELKEIDNFLEIEHEIKETGGCDKEFLIAKLYIPKNGTLTPILTKYCKTGVGV